MSHQREICSMLLRADICQRECLLGIMSRKFIIAGVDIAKYFVPASEIREFIPVELRAQVLMK
jgi:hypothetical protein